jgi:hypothetical protein
MCVKNETADDVLATGTGMIDAVRIASATSTVLYLVLLLIAARALR